MSVRAGYITERRPEDKDTPGSGIEELRSRNYPCPNLLLLTKTWMLISLHILSIFSSETLRVCQVLFQVPLAVTNKIDAKDFS